ncbi:hypothetical protein PanWU01x14_367840, partial [Parasponia andersonii]
SVVILDGLDALSWMSSFDGIVTCSDAYVSLSDSLVVCFGESRFGFPSSLLRVEDSSHLFLTCSFIVKLWSALSSLFRTPIFLEGSVRDLWDIAQLCSLSP